MIDPRLAVIDTRLAGVRRIVAVTGGKGGIGKSTIACLLALAAADRGLRTGLFDLDLTSPTDHVILGAPTGFPDEEFGIDPAMHAGVGLMSLALFAGSTPAPLRGDALTNAVLELLAITRWGELDLLVLDMPPGLGDTALDAMRFVPRCEYLVVTTPSTVVRETVRRTLRLLKERGAPVLGLLENMQVGESGTAALAAEFGATVLGSVPRDDALEAATGDPDALRKTAAAAALRAIAPL
ncbi:MAG: P-loop NTPase [Planctomycetes bacterium]|nr:P-loop NTPase [Planctomycetota bacterium]